MGSVGTLRFFGIGRTSKRGQKNSAPTLSVVAAPGPVSETSAATSSAFLQTLGWISAGAGALGLGLVIGRELRQRYKFNRRTPYDVYAHAGDYQSDLEFGVGV